MSHPLPELQRFGERLLHARIERGLSQEELAVQCDLAQQQVSLFEAGRRLPTLAQCFRLTKALDVPLQRLISGSDRPGRATRDLAVELRGFGVIDLWVNDAVPPGAFRRPEEVAALAVSDPAPDPRIIEALPAILAWTDMIPTLLSAYGSVTGTLRRLAWMADVVLVIEKKGGFPGGCRKDTLEEFLKTVALPPEGTAWDSLGKSSAAPPTSPIWLRWKIRYDATVDQFADRAAFLIALGGGPPERAVSRRRLRVAALALSNLTDELRPAPEAPLSADARRRLKKGAPKSAARKDHDDGR